MVLETNKGNIMTKLIKRSGYNLTYTSDKGNIEVVNCTNPNLYATTGYFIRLSMPVPSEVSAKCYRTAKQASKAAYNAMA